MQLYECIGWLFAYGKKKEARPPTNNANTHMKQPCVPLCTCLCAQLDRGRQNHEMPPVKLLWDGSRFIWPECYIEGGMDGGRERQRTLLADAHYWTERRSQKTRTHFWHTNLDSCACGTQVKSSKDIEEAMQAYRLSYVSLIQIYGLGGATCNDS